MKLCQKVLGFWDNGIWIGWGIFSQIWGEFLSSAVNVLANSPKISDLTKTDVFQMSLSQKDETIR